MHIGQISFENRLMLICYDSHIQKREVEFDGCHEFSGIQDQKKMCVDEAVC